MSQTKEDSVLDWKRLNWLLDSVKKLKDNCWMLSRKRRSVMLEIIGQHSDVVLVRIQVEIELMKEIANIDKRMSQAVVEAKDNQQLEDGCTKYNRVQWQSK
jgi:hypothetical protein